jgi:predicted GIY-YIG superfamily endonuclease
MPVAYRVYVRQNRAGRFYIGLSADVANRLAEHNAVRSRWARGKGPWQFVWESEVLALGAARNGESLETARPGQRLLFNYVADKKPVRNPAAAGSRVQIAPQPNFR